MEQDKTKSLSTIGSDAVTTLQKIEVATEGKKIIDCKDSEIESLLRYIIVLLGIPERNDLIQDQEGNKLGKLVLMNFIKGYWQQTCIEEIKLAFEFAVNGVTKCDLNLFDRPISAEFFGRVVTAYRVYARNIKDPAKKEVKQLPPVKTTDKQYYEGLIKFIERENCLPMSWDWNAVAWYMLEQEIIKRPTDQERVAHEEKIRKIVNAENILLKHRGKTQDIQDLIDKSLSQEGVHARCRKEYVIEFLQKKYKLKK